MTKPFTQTQRDLLYAANRAARDTRKLETVRDNLIAKCVSSGITQVRVAKAVSMSQAHVSRTCRDARLEKERRDALRASSRARRR